GAAVIVHLIDGTYELFRHFYGLRRFGKDEDRPFGAVVGVLNTALQMIEGGATHLAVATDHVIESFRNALWSGYKTGGGIEPALLAQFRPLEEALTTMGVVVWPMIELEADDALASAARLIARYGAIEEFPATVLGERRELALLFKTLATLRTDAELFEDVDELRWRGPTAAFSACAAHLGDERLLGRSRKAPVAEPA